GPIGLHSESQAVASGQHLLPIVNSPDSRCTQPLPLSHPSNLRTLSLRHQTGAAEPLNVANLEILGTIRSAKLGRRSPGGSHAVSFPEASETPFCSFFRSMIENAAEFRNQKQENTE